MPLSAHRCKEEMKTRMQVPFFGIATVFKGATHRQSHRRLSVDFWLHGRIRVNPIQGRGGGGHIVPPQVNFLKYLKNALSYRVETFWIFKWTNFQKMYLVFNCLRPPLVTIATPKVDACFRTTHFNSFHAKSPQNSKVFCYIFEGHWYF